MTKLFLNVTFVFQFFPWLSFRLFEGDTQPWPLLFSLVANLLFLKRVIDKGAAIILFCFVFSFILAIGYFRFDELTIRAIFGYATLFSAYYFYLEYRKRYDPTTFIVIINVVWLVAGLAQVVFDPYILDLFVTVRTSEGRGVTGLSPEPTFYGIFLYFMCWLIYFENKFFSKNNLCRLYPYLIFLNVVFIVFVAKSSMVVVFLCLTLLFFFLKNLRIKALVVCVLLFLLLAPFFNIAWYALEGTRVFVLATGFFDGGAYFLLRDASINSRISHVYLSFYEFISSGMLPHGYHSFGDKLEKLLTSSEIFYWGGNTNKIMSWLGGVFFELGFIGLVVVAWVSYSIMGTAVSYRRFLDVILFLLVLTSAIPLAFPLVPLILASARYQYIYRV